MGPLAELADKKQAGVAPDLADSASEQSLSELIMIATATNAAGSAATVEHFEHLLQKANNPRVVFMSTPMGSTGLAAEQLRSMPMPMPAYSASKAAMNMIALHYCKKYPQWKVNACTPGYRVGLDFRSSYTISNRWTKLW